jgi:WD40 repeat protein
MTPDGDEYLKGEVTSILMIDSNKLGVGYSNGMVRCFDANAGGAPLVSLMGHKGNVSCLAATNDGMLLCSGGNDTNIIVWDVVAERGICRLKGHKDAITAVRFVKPVTSVDTSVAAAEKTPATLVISGQKHLFFLVFSFICISLFGFFYLYIKHLFC